MSKRNGIKLSPKHGANPTIPLCFWCGQEKNEIARIGEDIEVPRHMVLDYNPCDKCSEQMALGVTCVEVVDSPPHENMPELIEGHYPTGRWGVLATDAVKRIFNLDLENGKKLLVSEETFSAIFTSPIME